MSLRSICPRRCARKRSRSPSERSTRCAITVFRRRKTRSFPTSPPPRVSRSTPSTATTCWQSFRTSTSRCTRPRISAATGTCCSTRIPTSCAALTGVSIGPRCCATRSTTTAWSCFRSPLSASRITERFITRFWRASATKRAVTSRPQTSSRLPSPWGSSRTSTCAWWRSSFPTCARTSRSESACVISSTFHASRCRIRTGRAVSWPCCGTAA